MKLVKESGNGQFKEMRPNEMRNQQSDLIADIVCNKCEILFSKSDEFGAYFFKESRYLIGIKPTQGLEISNSAQIHSGEIVGKLDLFIASLILRLELYARSEKNLSLLGPFCYDLSRQFLKGKIDNKKFGCFLFHQPNLDTTISPPMRNVIEDRNCIVSYFLGYKVIFFLSNRGLPESVWHTRQEKFFIIPVLNTKDPEFRSIIKKLIVPNVAKKN